MLLLPWKIILWVHYHIRLKKKKIYKIYVLPFLNITFSCIGCKRLTMAELFRSQNKGVTVQSCPFLSNFPFYTTPQILCNRVKTFFGTSDEVFICLFFDRLIHGLALTDHLNPSSVHSQLDNRRLEHLQPALWARLPWADGGLRRRVERYQNEGKWSRKSANCHFKQSAGWPWQLPVVPPT